MKRAPLIFISLCLLTGCASDPFHATTHFAPSYYQQLEQTDMRWLNDTNNSAECYLRMVAPIAFKKMSSAQPASVIQPSSITRALTNITLGWLGTDTNAIGYKLYYGHATGEYVGALTVWNVTNATASLESGYDWNFSVTAIDDYPGDESAFSDEAKASPPLALNIYFPNPGILQSSIDLVNWSTRDATFDGNVYRVSPQAPMEFYRTTTTK